MAIIAARAGAQQVFDVDYLSVEITHVSDSFECLALFQHLLCLRPMVALTCVWYVIKNDVIVAVAC